MLVMSKSKLRLIPSFFSFFAILKKLHYLCVSFWYTKSNIMEVVSTREFRNNMATYLSYISSGQELILKTRDKGSFVIRKVKEDDTLMSKEEFFAKIKESEKQIERGEYSVMKPDETLDEFLERVTNVQD